MASSGDTDDPMTRTQGQPLEPQTPTVQPNRQSPRKRARSPSPAQGSTRGGPLTARKKARLAVTAPKNPPQPKKPSDWHLRKDEIPEDAKKTKLAFELHIRCLWGLPTQDTPPPSVSDSDIELYDSRFTSEAAIRSTVYSRLDESQAYVFFAETKVKNLLKALPAGRIISNNIQRMDQAHLLRMYRKVASLGLPHWKPDVLRGNPESKYNLLHEHLAINTFEEVADSGAYTHVGINLAYVRNPLFTQKIYRSYVFSYMHDLAKLEAKMTGGVAKSNKMDSTYKRRRALAYGRINTLISQGFNKRVLALARENEAHSDDEFDNERRAYIVKTRAGRSTKVSSLFRMADELRLGNGKYKRGQREERQRQVPNPPQSSEFTTIPKNVPIDWFSPAFWNNELTVRQRIEFMGDETNPVVALPLEEHCVSWMECAKWKNLPTDQFMAIYGNAVLEQYILPTEEERRQIAEWDRPVNLDSDHDEDGENIDQPTDGEEEDSEYVEQLADGEEGSSEDDDDEDMYGDEAEEHHGGEKEEEEDI